MMDEWGIEPYTPLKIARKWVERDRRGKVHLIRRSFSYDPHPLKVGDIYGDKKSFRQR